MSCFQDLFGFSASLASCAAYQKPPATKLKMIDKLSFASSPGSHLKQEF
jgi:hypothetical protein